MNKKIKDYCDMMGFYYKEFPKSVNFYQKIGKYVEYRFAQVPIDFIENHPEEALKALIEVVKSDKHLNVPTSGRYPWEET